MSQESLSQNNSSGGTSMEKNPIKSSLLKLKKQNNKKHGIRRGILYIALYFQFWFSQPLDDVDET